MELKRLVETSQRISATRSKKEKISLLSDLLRQTRGRETTLAASYLSGRLPQGRLGVGFGMLQEAARDLSPSAPPLVLSEVDALWENLSREEGAGSNERKIGILRRLLSRGDEAERDFLLRLVLGEIRQGALGALVLEAIARASSLTEERIRQAFMFSGDIGEVARMALEEGSAGLSRFGPRLFHPISPMLASTAAGEKEALERLGEAGWEYKIDGARVQVHKRGDEVRVFTRHLKDVTESIPEIVTLARGLPVKESILEGEALALGGNGQPLPFQITMRRFGRIKEVGEMQKKLPLAHYFFDLLYLDGQPFFDIPYRERIEQLVQVVPSGSIVPRIITADEEEARAFLHRSLEAGHEGLMAKGLDAPYQAGHRGFGWLKIKPAHTLDLVVLAAEWGHGRRRGWLSNLHLGAWDPDSGSFIMLGKTFKGLTDEMLRWQTQKLLALEMARDDWTVYVRPELVVEIAFGDLQESPRYPASLALRFARVRRFRQDKTPLEADTIQRVRMIFESSRSK